MTMTRTEKPERLCRAMVGTPEIDLEKRTITAQVMTRALARDGGIVVPGGIITKFFETNPVVMARHGQDYSSVSPVIGRSLGLTTDNDGMVSETQFADTELAREWAYLYGLNPAKEVYMRMWSFGWSTLQIEWWTLDTAERWLGDRWDAETVDMWAKRYDEVWVAIKSEMHEYSAVPVGADRNALSRAMKDGVRTAGSLIAEIDLGTARQEVAALQNRMARDEIRKLNDQIQALFRDGAAAAERGDTAGLVDEIRAMTKTLAV